MRKLNTGDVFACARCLKAIGARETIKKYAQQADKASDLFENGFMLFWELMEAASDARSESAVYEFLARPFEMDPAQVEQLPLADIAEMLKKLAEENDLKSFFKSAAV